MAERWSGIGLYHAHFQSSAPGPPADRCQQLHFNRRSGPEFRLVMGLFSRRAGSFQPGLGNSAEFILLGVGFLGGVLALKTASSVRRLGPQLLGLVQRDF